MTLAAITPGIKSYAPSAGRGLPSAGAMPDLRFNNLYMDGIELCNGFHELGDAQEQRARFESDVVQRARRSLPAVPIDENFLAALEHGLPECSGVALGFDRLVMCAIGARHIDEVLAFPFDRA